MGQQVINVSSGVKRYVGGTITETTGKDISGDTVAICLGSDTQPGTFGVPDVRTGSGSSVTVKLLVTNAVAPGTYYVWVKVTDTPEVEAFVIDGPIYVQ